MHIACWFFVAWLAGAAARAGASPAAVPATGPEAPPAPAPPAAPSLPPSAPPAPPASAAEARFLRAHWLSLYLEGRKVGYVTESLYALADGGRRLQRGVFLKTAPRAGEFGYVEAITADVDARFRPVALDCRVLSAARSWQVTGRAENGELALTRTLDGASATARIPIEDDVTFLAWTVPATLLSGTPPGRTRRWLVVDESLGAMLPEPCLVANLGPQSGVLKAGEPPVSGTAVGWACGVERVGHLLGADGRVLRSVWQTAPLVAEAAGLTEARRAVAPDGPTGLVIEGLEAGRYTSDRLGLSLEVPAMPCVAHVVAEAGAVQVVDLTDEAYVLVRPAPGPPAAGAAPPSEADTALRADLAQREWAARWDEVQADPARTETVGGREARTVTGTARLGCTTFHFRNALVPGDGVAWHVSAVAADRPLRARPGPLAHVVESIRVTAPQGRMPLLASGDRLVSRHYGFEVTRPGPRWRIPTHMDGPATALELVREDHAAVAVVRVFALRSDESLGSLVADQARQAVENLGVPRPEPKAATLGGRKALELAYEAPRALSGRPARCTAVYTMLDGRALALVLLAATDADAGAAEELRRLRESLKFAGP